jgi:hypothetical protein
VLYLIFRKFVKLGFIESLLLSAFFFSSANVINPGTGVWSQRASVFLIPPILLMALVSARMREGRSRLGLAWLSGLLSSLLFTQDFYTGALAVLVAALFLAGALPAAPPLIKRGDPGLLSRRPSPWWLITACVSLVWAVAVQVHPIARTTIGPLTFSATNPIRSLYIAILTGGWFVCRKSDLAGRIMRWWKRDRSYMLAFTLGEPFRARTGEHLWRTTLFGPSHWSSWWRSWRGCPGSRSSGPIDSPASGSCSSR